MRSSRHSLPFLLLIALILRANCLPVHDHKVKFEKSTAEDEIERNLVDYLNWYYDNYVGRNDIDFVPKIENEKDLLDQMQSDQAPPVDADQLNPLYTNLSSIVKQNGTADDEYRRIQRQKRDSKTEDRNKEAWMQILRNNVLRYVGRDNASTSRPPNGLAMSGLNISQIMPELHIPHEAIGEDEFVTEKIRSYYPSCEMPKNTDQDLWQDQNTMNLYFNVDNPDSASITVATATLRLYRVPSVNTTTSTTSTDSCENSTGNEEQLMRISIYWYTKSLKRQRVKRRLSDSKVIGSSAEWVELSVLPATKAWMKGKNMGLAILVEDQEGTVLKADKYFKGATCMQPQNLYQQSSLTQPDEQVNWNALMAVLDEIQHQPSITIYRCFLPLTYVP